MDELNYEDLAMLLSIMSTRLKHEARRPPRYDSQGHDMQAYKVRMMAELVEKLERMKLAL